MNWKNIRPYPVLSENIVQELCNAIKEADTPRMFIEYGSGGSTLFYLDFMLKNRIEALFVSVECVYQWHQSVVQNIQERHKKRIVEERSCFEEWGDFKCRKYLNTHDQFISFNVPDSIKMLSIGRKRVRETLLSKDKTGGNFRLLDGYYAAIINEIVNFNYILKTELFKDQFGESPIKDEYIRAGLDEVENFLAENCNGSVVMMIDGGPRVDILRAVFETERKYADAKLTIWLHDASRLFYHDILNSHLDGRFIKGSNRLISGEATFTSGKESELNEFIYGSQDLPIEMITEKEAWVYQKV